MPDSVNALNDMFMPQYALTVMDDGNGNEVMGLEIATASVQIQCVLATPDNYMQVASKLAESIRRIGAEMKHKSKLITNVKELPDGLRKT